MKIEDVIAKLIEHDLDDIRNQNTMDCIKDMLEGGLIGYNQRTKRELEDFYYDAFDEQITIED